jgi:hypothetical protein
MMMKPISHSLRDVLVRQGIANAKPVGAGKVRGMKGPGAASDGALGGVAADAREGGQERPPIGRLGGARQPMGMEPGKGRGPQPAPVYRGKRQPEMERGAPVTSDGYLRLIVNPNMSGMPMRKRAMQTPFLICIEGGKP